MEHVSDRSCLDLGSRRGTLLLMFRENRPEQPLLHTRSRRSSRYRRLGLLLFPPNRSLLASLDLADLFSGEPLLLLLLLLLMLLLLLLLLGGTVGRLPG